MFFSWSWWGRREACRGGKRQEELCTGMGGTESFEQ